MAIYVALLRGINVGGKNLIKMADLKECFGTNGFEHVTTYIQSGNVVFGSPTSGLAALTDRIESMVANTFGLALPVVVRSHRQMKATVEAAPHGFGAEPDRYRYDVIFLKAPLTSAAALKTVPMKQGVDQAAAGPGALYYSRLTSRATQSRLSKVVSMPIYQRMTIRNWTTTTKLLGLMETATR